MCDDCHDTHPCADCEPPVLPGPCLDCEAEPVTPAGLLAGSEEDPCDTDWLARAKRLYAGGGGGEPPPPPLPPTVYYSVAAERAFVRSNCGAGLIGTSVTVRVAARAFSSLLSQADADAKAQAWLSATGPMQANQRGTCIADTGNNPIFWDVLWAGEAGCTAGPSFAGISWGWESGVVDAGCPGTLPVFAGVEWGEAASCPDPVTRLFGVEWGIITCN